MNVSRLPIAPLFILALATTLSAAPPVITNISASQRPGTKLIDVTYTVADPDSASLTVQAEFSAIAMVSDFDISIPEFEADAEQLTQVVMNIARNAAQALAGAVAAPQIRFETRIARGVTLAKKRHRLALALSIHDNGPGVPEAIRDRIFYPLVSGRDGGSGLGLTIAQTFVAQHHGSIEWSSVPGHTVFTIVIPLELTRAAA